MDNNKFKLAYRKLMSATSVLVVGHISPDPDALSSIGAILELLQQKNISFIAYADDKIDGLYDFIPHENLITKNKPDNLNKFDVIIVLDCGSLARTGLGKEIKEVLIKREKKSPFIIEFDHHEHQDNYADLEIRLSSRASTTEIIYDFLQANNKEINKKIADCILIGLMSDTGHFIHPNSSFQALAVSSEMLLKGASLKKISSYIKGQSSLTALKVWGRCFKRLKFNQETKLACTALTQKDIEELDLKDYRTKLSDIFGDIVSFISYLPGVSVALFLREEKGKIKGSLRANNGNINVSYIASLFGGGGHKRAAGFSLSGKLKETQDGWKVIKES